MKPLIRLATVSDIPSLLPLLKEFSDFGSKKVQLWPGEEVASQILQQLVIAHAFFVALQDDEVVGCIAGLWHPCLFNPKIRMLSELFWWVKPKYRHGRAGAMLLDTFITWGKTVADITVMTLETDSPVNPRSLEKRGFVARERNFTLEL